jgi:hypothetical protein
MKINSRQSTRPLNHSGYCATRKELQNTAFPQTAYLRIPYDYWNKVLKYGIVGRQTAPRGRSVTAAVRFDFVTGSACLHAYVEPNATHTSCGLERLILQMQRSWEGAQQLSIPDLKQWSFCGLIIQNCGPTGEFLHTEQKRRGSQ